jgi:hypothetical protein
MRWSVVVALGIFLLLLPSCHGSNDDGPSLCERVCAQLECDDPSSLDCEELCVLIEERRQDSTPECRDALDGVLVCIEETTCDESSEQSIGSLVETCDPTFGVQCGSLL